MTATFGGMTFGFTGSQGSVAKTYKGVIPSDYITSLSIDKYGSGAVNQYTLTLTYVIIEGSDPNYIDEIISKNVSREIEFTYGDLTQPEYSYQKEQGIITKIVPSVDYKNNKITYTITATSSVALSYANKTNYPQMKSTSPSQVILDLLFNTSWAYYAEGLRDLFPGMTSKDYVTMKGWIPNSGIKSVDIAEKTNIAPFDYILYLVSLMKDSSNNFYNLKIFDSRFDPDDPLVGPHFEIQSTASKTKSQMMTITVGYPGSIPVYSLDITEDSSRALLVEYSEENESGVMEDYNLNGDLVRKDFYSRESNNGVPSANAKNWWEKMLSFPIKATLTTDGLYVPADLIQSIYLEIYFFGKKYNQSGEYIITAQKDEISASGFRTTLSLLRTGDGES